MQSRVLFVSASLLLCYYEVWFFQYTVNETNDERKECNEKGKINYFLK